MQYYIYRHKLPLLISSLCYLVSAGLEVLFAFYLGDMIDYILKGQEANLYWASLQVVLAVVGTLLTLIIATYTKRVFVEKVMTHVKKDIAAKLFRVPYAAFEAEDNAYYLNLLSNDMNLLDDEYLKYMTMIAMHASQFILALGALLSINVFLTICFALLLLLPISVPMLFSKRLQRNKEHLSEDNEAYTFCVKEMIEGYECIRTNNIAAKFLNRFDRDTKQREASRRRSTALEMNSFNTSGMLGAISQCLCFLIGGLLVIRGELTAGMLMTAVQLLNYVVNPIASFSEILTYMKGAKPIIDKVQTFLHQNEEREDKQQSLDLTDEWNLSYQNVSFGYTERPVIENFSDTFSAGQKYAIIGTSGCGKSTVTRLLMQYYQDYQGTIQIGHQSASRIRKQDIYDLISVVHQNTFIFNDTILNNITMYRDYDEQLVQSVIEKVNLTELMKAHGNEPIGDFGRSISGGEKQRIAIARALLKQSRVIIFDEACASLDPNNAHMINDLIFSLQDILCIVVTHDWTPAFLERFHRVIKMDQACQSIA